MALTPSICCFTVPSPRGCSQSVCQMLPSVAIQAIHWLGWCIWSSWQTQTHWKHRPVWPLPSMEWMDEWMDGRMDGSLKPEGYKIFSLSFQILGWNGYLGARCVPPSVCDRPFITGLSVRIELSPLLWWQHYSSGSVGREGGGDDQTSPAADISCSVSIAVPTITNSNAICMTPARRACWWCLPSAAAGTPVSQGGERDRK